MSNEDEPTVKLRAYPDKAERVVLQSNLTEAQNNALELVKKAAQLEEEKKKSAEHLKTIEHLRECLKQEQARTAEFAEKVVALEAKLKESAGLAAKTKELAELETKVRELTEVLGRISGITGSGKAG